MTTPPSPSRTRAIAAAQVLIDDDGDYADAWREALTLLTELDDDDFDVDVLAANIDHLRTLAHLVEASPVAVTAWISAHPDAVMIAPDGRSPQAHPRAGAARARLDGTTVQVLLSHADTDYYHYTHGGTFYAYLPDIPMTPSAAAVYAELRTAGMTRDQARAAATDVTTTRPPAQPPAPDRRAH